MAARRPFWKWCRWKSIGFCLLAPSTCLWNLKLKFQSKLDLYTGNHVVYRQTDGQTDGRTGWIQYTPHPPTSLGGGITICFFHIKWKTPSYHGWPVLQKSSGPGEHERCYGADTILFANRWAPGRTEWQTDRMKPVYLNSPSLRGRIKPRSWINLDIQRRKRPHTIKLKSAIPTFRQTIQIFTTVIEDVLSIREQSTWMPT